MSDSEDEAFQSADEGEGPAAATAQVKPKTKEQSAAPAGKGKKQQKRNRKKKGSQNVEKEEPVGATKGKSDLEPTKLEENTEVKDDSSKTDLDMVKDKTSTAQEGKEKDTKGKSDSSSPKENTKQEKTKTCESETKNDARGEKPDNTEPVKETDTGATETDPPTEKSDESCGNIVAEQPSVLPNVEASSPEKPTEQHESILDKLSDAAKPVSTIKCAIFLFHYPHDLLRNF